MDKDKIIQELTSQINYLDELYSDINNGNLITESDLLDEILNSKFCMQAAILCISENKGEIK